MNTITTWSDVADTIKSFGLLMIDRRKLEGDMNKHITAAKDRFAPKIESLDQEMGEIQSALYAWCMEQRGEMVRVKGGKGLTWACAYGKVAFRVCPSAITFTKKNMEKVLAALKARKLWNCIRTSKEPNKEAMELLDDKTLKACGGKRSAGEKFELKPDYSVLSPIKTSSTEGVTP